jgi:carbonic anhydrase
MVGGGNDLLTPDEPPLSPISSSRSLTMCRQCADLGRRRFLSAAAAVLATATILPHAGRAASVLTPDQALAKLKAGNQTFMTAPQLCEANLGQQRTSVAKAQAPWATILTCADSRVPPELIFGGVGLGELFVARNAGAMADTATIGTIEYGAEHLHSPLIVVLGHQRCGAVAAACDVAVKHTKLPGSIGPMVDAIVPAALAVQGKPGDFIDNAMRENARRTAGKIVTQSKIVEELMHEGALKVVYARYDLDTGNVDFLS